MLRSLKRLKHIRLLQEEARKLEFSLAVARLSQLEQSSVRAIAESRLSRSSWFLKVHGENTEERGRPQEDYDSRSEAKINSDPALRLVDEEAWEQAMAEHDAVEIERPLQELLVARAQEEFLSCRRDRLEVETLLAEAQCHLRLNRDRQEQRMLDEWFQTNSRRGEDSETKGLF